MGSQDEGTKVVTDEYVDHAAEVRALLERQNTLLESINNNVGALTGGLLAAFEALEPMVSMFGLEFPGVPVMIEGEATEDGEAR